MVVAEIQASRLSRALRAVTVLVDSATIHFGPDGLRVRTVDPANVGEVSMTLLSGAFSRYEAEATEVDINIDRLSNVVRQIDGNTVVELSYNQNADSLRLNAGSYNFDLSLIDPDSARSGKGPADINPPGMIKIKAGEIKSAINIAEMFSEEMIIGIDEKEEIFYMNASGDIDTMAVSFDREDGTVYELNAKRAHTVFGLTYLSKMFSVIPASREVKIEIGEEYPAKIHFNIANENGRVTYGLAPRII